MLSQIPDTQQRQLSEFIAETLGLHFPLERWDDLQRNLAGAAGELGFRDLASCADWLLSAPLTRPQIQVLANHLTVGETYFFREKKVFDALASHALPELIGVRRGREQRLRFWCAACCTGEEPYSLAILLREALSDLSDWHVRILATDINARFLEKAAAGVYGEWSFRDTPTGFKERYFKPARDGRYAIVPEIKRMVTFAQLNLAEDVYPSVANDTNAMDVILCRNVLMYFTPAKARKVAENFHRALVDGGWLVVSPSEASHALFSQFATVNLPGAILYQKRDIQQQAPPRCDAVEFSERMPFVLPPLPARNEWGEDRGEGQANRDGPPPHEPTPSPLPGGEPRTGATILVPLLGGEGGGFRGFLNSTAVLPLQETVDPKTRPSPYAEAEALYQQGRYAEAAATLLGWLPTQPPRPKSFSLLARALANQGRLAEALAESDRWIAADKLDPAGHYLRALILQELGDAESAHRAFERAVYLDPRFALAHFALGNLARNAGKNSEAERHFRNVLRLVEALDPSAVLAESDGLTSGRLAEIVAAWMNLETAP